MGCLGLIVVFFVPFNEKVYNTSSAITHRRYSEENIPKFSENLIFDSLWSNHTGMISLRLFMEILILTLVSVLFYFILSKFKSPDFNDPKIKKVIRREIKIILIFVILNCCIALFFLLYNNIQNRRYKDIQQKIKVLEDKNKDLLTKINLKIDNQYKFYTIYHEMFYRIKSDEKYNNDWWNGVMNDFTNQDLFDRIYNKIEPSLRNKLLINSDKDLKQFLEINSRNDEDSTNQQQSNLYDSQISFLKSDRIEINLYNSYEMQNNFLLFGILPLCCFYVLRVLYYYGGRLYLYLK